MIASAARTGLFVLILLTPVCGEVSPDFEANVLSKIVPTNVLAGAEPIELSIAKTALAAESAKGLPWKSFESFFLSKKHTEPQGSIGALVSPRFAKQDGLAFDYWMFAGSYEEKVYFTEASFKAEEIDLSPQEIVGKTPKGRSIIARILLLPAVQKIAQEFPRLHTLELRCRPLASSVSGLQRLLFHATARFVPNSGIGRYEQIHVGAELHLRMNADTDEGKAILAKSTTDAHLYLREEDGSEVFWDLGGSWSK